MNAKPQSKSKEPADKPSRDRSKTATKEVVQPGQATSRTKQASASEGRQSQQNKAIAISVKPLRKVSPAPKNQKLGLPAKQTKADEVGPRGCLGLLKSVGEPTRDLKEGIFGSLKGLESVRRPGELTVITVDKKSDVSTPRL